MQPLKKAKLKKKIPENYEWGKNSNSKLYGSIFLYSFFCLYSVGEFSRLCVILVDESWEVRGGDGLALIVLELQCETMSNNGERALVREELGEGDGWKSRDFVSGESKK